MSSKKDENGVFCHCRAQEHGFMIECESCQEWFHGRCVGIKTHTEAKKLISWSCFVCVRVNGAVTKLMALMENLSKDVKRSKEEEISTERETCSGKLREEKNEMLQKISAFQEEILCLQQTVTSRDELLEIARKEKSDLLKNIHDLEQQLRDVKEKTEDVSLKQEVSNLMEKLACCEEEHSSAQEKFRKVQSDLMDSVQSLQQQLKEEKIKSHNLGSELKGIKRRKLSLKLQSQET